jgi:hypothetical protein
VHKVLQEVKDFKELQVYQVLLVGLVLKVYKVIEDLKVVKDHLEQQVYKERKDHGVHKVLLVPV